MATSLVARHTKNLEKRVRVSLAYYLSGLLPLRCATNYQVTLGDIRDTTGGCLHVIL